MRWYLNPSTLKIERARSAIRLNSDIDEESKTKPFLFGASKTVIQYCAVLKHCVYARVRTALHLQMASASPKSHEIERIVNVKVNNKTT